MMRDSTRQQQRSTILPPSVGSAWTTPYSLDLAPSDFHFFPTLKSTLEGRRFTTDEDAEAAIRTQDADF
jgi:hypothetical protein